MIIDLGVDYKLECLVEDGKPIIRLVGEYTTVNGSYDGRSSFTYLNKGPLAFKSLDFNSDVVIKAHSLYQEGEEVLISFNTISSKVDVYFNLVKGNVGYSIN